MKYEESRNKLRNLKNFTKRFKVSIMKDGDTNAAGLLSGRKE